ncbi:MAG: hypothetical protein ACJZ4F_03400 [Candidatus Thalassarchaeaceae archaeon]
MSSQLANLTDPNKPDGNGVGGRDGGSEESSGLPGFGLMAGVACPGYGSSSSF